MLGLPRRATLAMRRTTARFITAALALAMAGEARSQEEDTDAVREGGIAAEAERDDRTLADRIKAVERKVFLKRRRFELQPYVGMDLNDAFFQHFFVGASAGYHLGDNFAVELRGGASVAEIQKGSVRFVRVATGSLLEGAPSLVAHADLNALWAPVYGKLSLFGESILHFDTFVTAGGGIFVTDRPERRDGVLVEATNVNPALNLGLGQRYFITEWLVFRWDLRNYSFLETGAGGSVQNVTVLGLALSGFFPTSFSYDFQ